MLAYEEVLTDYWYYDTDGGCGQWTQGTYDTVVVLNFYEYDHEVDRVDFDINEVPSYEVTVCDSCSDRYTVNEYEPLIQYAPGQSVWVCGKCETWYVEEEDAVECCKEDDV